MAALTNQLISLWDSLPARANTAPNDQKLPTTTPDSSAPAKAERERRYNRLNPMRVASTGAGASRLVSPTGTMARARNTAARVKGVEDSTGPTLINSWPSAIDISTIKV